MSRMQRAVAERLRVIRARQGLSLVEAAERTGVDRHTIAALERGKRAPYFPTVEKLAQGYGVAAEEILSVEVAEDATPPKAQPPVSQQRRSALKEEGDSEADVHLLASELRTAMQSGGITFAKLKRAVDSYCEKWEEDLAREITPKMRERGTTFAAGAHTTAGRDAFIDAAGAILPALEIARNAEVLVLEHEFGLDWDDPQAFNDCLDKSEIWAVSQRYLRLLEAVMDAQEKAEEDAAADREAVRRREQIRELSQRLRAVG